MRSICLLATFGLAAAACGGADTGPVTMDEAQDVCQRTCDHDHACDPTSDVTTCVDECVADITGWVRADVIEAAADCEVALACDASDDSCFEDACEPTSAHDAYETRCRERFAECGVSGTDLDSICEVTPGGSSGTSGGDVGFFCVVAPSIMDDFTACFDEADCNAIQTCFQQVASANGIDL